MGKIGQAVAKRALGFDMEILYNKRNKEITGIDIFAPARRRLLATPSSRAADGAVARRRDPVAVGHRRRRDGGLRHRDNARVSEAVSIPVIASGGAGNFDHMIAALRDRGATAVAAASIFHFTELTPAEAKQALGSAGIPVPC